MTIPHPRRAADDLITAPVGIAHLTGDNTDLIRARTADATRLRVTTAAQLNGTPHFGTVVTVLLVFALTRHAANRLGLPTTVVFDALENAPAEQITYNDEIYTRNVGDLMTSGAIDRAHRIGGFERLLNFAATRSGLRYEFRSYTVYQGLRPVRECLHHIAARPEEFAPIVAPSDGRIRIRPRCPEAGCQLMQKSARDLAITALDDAVRLHSLCPVHGPYAVTIPVDGDDGWYDANTPIRSIQKGYLLAAERDLYDACPISIDGADWGGAWHAHVLAPALAALAIPPARWPVSIFTPLILDASGGKLSKSLYVRHGAYADLPDIFLDLDALLTQHGEAILDVIWAEVTRWAEDPARLHRSYSVDYLRGLLATALTDTATSRRL